MEIIKESLGCRGDWTSNNNCCGICAVHKNNHWLSKQAGRKPMFGTTLNRYQVMLTQEQHQKALQLGDGNLSAGVRLAIDFKRVLDMGKD